MNKTGITTSITEQNRTISTYYQFQSRIYDITRWSFLFGRRQIVDALPFRSNDHFSLVEVGCGTGYNLRNIARKYPHAQLYGMDLSSDMLAIAKKNVQAYSARVKLQKAPYGLSPLQESPDVILFSYSLTMINPQWEELIRQACQDLRPGGYVAVTDFHDSKRAGFKDHMSGHHVRMDSHLLPVLRERLTPVIDEVKSAYFGSWEYFVFLGKR